MGRMLNSAIAAGLALSLGVWTLAEAQPPLPKTKEIAPKKGADPKPKMEPKPAPKTGTKPAPKGNPSGTKTTKPVGTPGTKPTESARIAAEIAPFVTDMTFAVVHIDLAAIDVAESFKFVNESLPIAPAEEMKTPEGMATGMLGAARETGAKDIYLVASLEDLPDLPPFIVIPVADDDSAKKVTDFVGEQMPFLPPPEMVGKALVFSAPPVVARVKALKPAARPELATALAAAGPGVAQVVLFTNDGILEKARTLGEQLPPDAGPAVQMADSALTGISWVALGLSLPPKPGLQLTVQAKDDASAGKLLGMIEMGLAAVQGAPQFAEHQEIAKEMTALFTPKMTGSKLSLTLNKENGALDKLTTAMLPAVEQARAAAERAKTSNALKQIGLAFHMYHDTHGTFPPRAKQDEAKKKNLLSWRVLILPFVEEGALYEEFKLDEPWDSPHNKALIERMPALYKSPMSKNTKPGMTTFSVPVVKDSLIDTTKALKMSAVTDGLSNTVMAVDTSDDKAVIWTKPDDWEVGENPIKELVGHFAGKFMVLFADGAVRVFDEDLPEETFKAILTKSGGEAVELP